jgi:hypothetical protein
LHHFTHFTSGFIWVPVPGGGAVAVDTPCDLPPDLPPGQRQAPPPATLQSLAALARRPLGPVQATAPCPRAEPLRVADPMPKLSMKETKNKLARIYGIGILVFVAAFGSITLLVLFLSRLDMT